MFTSGNIYFALLFVAVFTVGMIWSYKKDSVSSKIHFQGASKVLLFIVITFVLLVLFIKIRHFIDIKWLID